MTDNIIDRDQLQEAYIESIIDGMDHKTMYQFVYTLKFKDEVQSMRLFNKKEMVETVNSRLDIHGYTVTDFLTEPQQYMPASCWYEIR